MKKLKLSAVTAAFLMASTVHSVELTPRVIGTGGNDLGLYITAVADGNYVGCGITDSISGNYDVIAFKLKPDGTQVWQTVVLKASGQLDRCHGLVETEEGDLILSGHTTSGGASRFATYVTRLDSSGNQKWFKTYFNQNEDYDTNYSIAESPNHDGFVVVGATTLYDAWADLSIRKISSAGDKEWSQTIRSPYYNVGEDIKSTPDGYIITGITGGSSPQESDGQVTKISLSGEVVWKQTVGTSGVRDELFSSTITDQIVYSTGFVTNSSGDQDVVLTARSLDDGVLIFEKTFGEIGINEFSTRGSNIRLNPATNTIFIAGSNGLEGLVIEADLQGNLLNLNKYGGNNGQTVLKGVAFEQNGSHMMIIGITDSAVFQTQQTDILLLTVKNSYTAFGTLLGKKGKKLGGATIYLGDSTALTSADGNWSVSDLSPGKYEIVAKKGKESCLVSEVEILDNGEYQQQVNYACDLVTYGDNNASVIAIWQSVNGNLQYVDTVRVEAFDAKFQEGRDYKIVDGAGEYVLEGIDDAGNTTSKVNVVRIQ